MITRNKNKSKSGAKSKILVLGFILVILVGLFGPKDEVRAQDYLFKINE